MAVGFKWKKNLKQIETEALGGDKALLFMAEDWHRLYSPFVPMETGILNTGQARHYVEGGKGIIAHQSPYAHRLYNGKGFRFAREHHPLASAEWDKAAISAGKDKQLANDMQKYITRGH
jgi:hypothetical protein